MPTPRKLETTGTILIQEHYREIGIESGWKNKRVYRLCEWLHCTLEELGCLAALTFDQIRRYNERDAWPPTVALHFFILEKCYLTEIRKSPQVPAVPLDLVLNTSPHPSHD